MPFVDARLKHVALVQQRAVARRKGGQIIGQAFPEGVGLHTCAGQHLIVDELIERLCNRDLTGADMGHGDRSEEHTSELQSLMRISYAVFCLKKKKEKTVQPNTNDKNNTQHDR